MSSLAVRGLLIFPLLLGAGSTICTAASPGDEVPVGQNATELKGIRGVVKAGAEATISSEIAARISEMPFKEGEAFVKGETLVNFDCSLLYASVEAARAEQAAREKRYENNQQLAELDAVGKLEVEISKAEATKAKADLSAARLQASRCRIDAPYAGRVVERIAHVYESVSPDQELIHIVDTSTLVIELIVPSSWLTWLKRGTKFDFLIDEIQEKHQAEIVRLGAMVDPVSHTVKVYGEFNGVEKGILTGMSGTARFSKQTGPDNGN